ncbi:ABC transporter permease [Cellulosimicrobium marinum]|uniref:ABC transporter permease n=1 Tax=Cellulosimicrobium marinum TaxID=1638992 RepID=UPI001E4B92D2|nr:ABC transporter permease subunit [Cellulosimicrobium marinum]MCB7136401.1 ABC transporter permease subunit [Cellulosimicrobium marinum]
MTLFSDAIAWIFSPDRATGALPLSEAIWTHLAFTFASVVLAALVAIPAGWAIGHTGRGREIAVGLSGAARAVPSFGLVLLLVLVFGVTHKVAASTTAFVLLAIPPILAGAYAGVEAVERRVIDGARSVGMTGRQVLWKVEAPLGLPLLIGGLRSATLQVVATVTLAGYVGNWGLGFYIVQGIQIRDFSQILGAALVIVVLAVVLDVLFALLQTVVVPRGVAAGRAPDDAPKRRRRRRPAPEPTTA